MNPGLVIEQKSKADTCTSESGALLSKPINVVLKNGFSIQDSFDESVSHGGDPFSTSDKHVFSLVCVE
ncbi:hypothetical protein J6590_068514 [Homalodisca vitripennis]|nr:hypothetical protein J6590_068514 [Homalodisca vitripennis]